MQKKLLITDDEENIIDVLKEYAKLEGYEVDTASNGQTAIEKAKKEEFDIIIMDIMMPGIDGITACREIRKFSDVPILFLSARTEESDKVIGFNMGGDDYVTKPFSPREVMARLAAIMKRSDKKTTLSENSPAIQKEQYEYGGLVIDCTARNVTIDKKKIDLTPKELDLLFYMVRNQNIALSRDQILNGVWGFDYFGDVRTVDTHIKMLRSSLGKYRKFVVTLRSMGYKFEV